MKLSMTCFAKFVLKSKFLKVIAMWYWNLSFDQGETLDPFSKLQHILHLFEIPKVFYVIFEDGGLIMLALNSVFSPFSLLRNSYCKCVPSGLEFSSKISYFLLVCKSFKLENDFWYKIIFLLNFLVCGLANGSQGKGICLLAWWPKFDPWVLYGRRKKTDVLDYKLSSDLHNILWHEHTHTRSLLPLHEQTNK